MTKNKLLKAALAAVFALVVGASLAACGQQPASSSASGTSPSASSNSSSKAEVVFTGDWKLAAIDFQGLVAVADFDNNEMFADSKFALSFKDDGTGTIGYNGEIKDFKWKAEKDGLAVTWSDEADAGKAHLIYDPLYESIQLTVDGEDSTTAYFTKDGSYKDYKVFDLKQAEPITDAKAVEGTWTLTGMGAMGMSMFGSAADMQKVAGSEVSLEMICKTDGTGTFGTGSDAQAFTWKTDDKGTTITMDALGTPLDCKLVSYGDAAILDMSPVLGGAMEMFFVYEPAK